MSGAVSETDGCQVIAQGKAEKGKKTATFTLPSSGIYDFDPETDYWKAAQIEFD